MAILALRLFWQALLLSLLVTSTLNAQGLVDPSSGALLLRQTDLTFRAGPVNIAVERVLQSKSRPPGALGDRWRLNWEATLWRVEGFAVVEEAAGPVYFLQEGANLIYTGSSGERVVFDARNNAVRTRSDGVFETFDAQGRLTKRDHRNGNLVRLQYNPDGRLARVKAPKDFSLVLRYEPGGRLAGIESSSGAKVQYTYARDHLAEVTVNSDPPTRYDYTSTGLLARIDSPLSGATDFSYDSKGRAVSRRFADANLERYEYGNDWFRRTNAAGGVTAIQWSSDRRREEITDPLGKRTTIEYDSSGRLRSASGPIGNLPPRADDAGASLFDKFFSGAGSTGVLARYTYDVLGRTLSVESPAGQVTRYEYLEETELIKAITHPDATRLEFEYDLNQNLVALRQDAEKTRSLSYQPDGLLRSIQGPDTPLITFAYHPDGRLSSRTDALGRVTRFEYDRRGNLIRETNPANGVTQYRYDGQDRLLSVTDPVGATTRYAYDNAGRLIAVTDPTDAVTKYEYDARGRLGASVDPAGRAERYEYDALNRLTAVTNPGGASDRFEYDPVGNLVRAINPQGGITQRTYDALGRIVTETDPANGQWRYEYSPMGQLILAAGPEGASVAYSYDPQGRRIALTLTGGAARFQRDGQGRVTSVTFPDGTVRKYQFDRAGNLSGESDTGSHQKTYAYDALGRMTFESSGTGLEVRYHYDALGNFRQVQDNLGNSVVQEHDLAGRLVSLAGPTGATTRYRYDPAGRIAEIIDPLGQVQKMSYTHAGELAQVTEPTGEATSYRYGSDGLLGEIRRPGGGVTRLAYETFWNFDTVTNPLGAKTLHEYDGAGRIISAADAKDQTTKYTYDTAGRLTEKRLADGKFVRYKYDTAGNLIEADDGSFPVRYTYDKSGRLIRIEYPAIRRSLSYTYDQQGILTQFTDSEGRRVQYLYDSAGRLGGLRLAEGRVIQFSYDAGDRITSVAYPNGVKGAWGYDARGLVSRISYTDGAGAVLAKWTYTYDPADNLVRAVDAQGRVQEYRYDAAGRLIEEQGSAGTNRFKYLPGGNRGRREASGRSTQYEYDLADRLTRAGDETFLHDANGNLIERRGPKGVTRYQYDAENSLVNVTKPDGREVAFGYAPTGERIWRKDPSGTTWFVTDGTNLLAELGDDLKPKASYLQAPGVDVPLMMFRDGQEYFYHAQALGTIAALTDSGGKPAARYETDAFGNLRQPPAVRNPFIFTAREWEPDLGLYYFRARYYDPALGRFLTEDPEWSPTAEPADLNRYVYARNAPTCFSDPWGLQTQAPPNSGISGAFRNRGIKPPFFLKPAILPGENVNSTAFWDRMARDYKFLEDNFGHGTAERFRQKLNQNLISRFPKPTAYKPGIIERASDRAKDLYARFRASMSPPTPTTRVKAPSRPGGADTATKVSKVPQSPQQVSSENVTPTTWSKVGKAVRVVGTVGGVAMTIYGGYKTGSAEGQAVVDVAVSQGRTPTKGEIADAAARAGAKTGIRTAAAIATQGISEGVIAWAEVLPEAYHQVGDLLDRYASEKRLDAAKEKARSKATALLGTVSRWLEEARTLKQQQDTLIQQARELQGTAGEAVDRLRAIQRAAPDTTALCKQCQARFLALRGLEGRMKTQNTTLEVRIANARERSATACQDPPPSEVQAHAAAAAEAAASAGTVAAQMAGISKEASGLEAERKLCVERLVELRSAVAEFGDPELQVKNAARAAKDASEASTAAKNIPPVCWNLRNKAAQIESLTAQGAEPTPIFSRLMDIESVCKDADRDAVGGETYVRLAEAAAGQAAELLPQVLETTKNQVPCAVGSPPEGYVEALVVAAAQAASQAEDARALAARAETCAASAKQAGPIFRPLPGTEVAGTAVPFPLPGAERPGTKPAGREPPPVVRASKPGTPTPGPQPPAPAPPPAPRVKERVVTHVYALVDGGGRRTHKNRQYWVLPPGSLSTVVASVGYNDGTQEILNGNPAFQNCLRLGYYTKVAGLDGWVRTGMAFAPQTGGSAGPSEKERSEGAGRKPSKGAAGAGSGVGAGGTAGGGSGGSAKDKGSDGLLLGTEFEHKDLPCDNFRWELNDCEDKCRRTKFEDELRCREQKGCYKWQDKLYKCEEANRGK